MLDILKHRLILTKIIKDIYSDFALSSIMGLKGGTALHFFYDLPRFSVDLDFNLIDLSKKKIVYRKMKNILKKYGTLKDEFLKRNTIFFLMSYETPDRNVKVEISLLQFPNEYEMKQYLGLSVLVMKKEYMFAHKLVALTERKGVANRDIFDIWFYLKNGWDLKDKIIELRTRTTVKEHIKKCITFIESVNQKNLLQGLGEVLDKKLKTWVKNNLISETVFYLRYYLEEIEKKERGEYK
jgi:predicted nucleotidyltransferase component of viral defense system